MLSSVITAYTKTARSLVALLRTHAQTVGAKAQDQLAPYCDKAKGEAVPDAGLLLELHARRLEKLVEALEKADTAHNAELADDHGPRRKRDESADALRAAVVEVKRTMASLFGAEAVAEFKLPTELPTEQESIIRVGRDVADTLEKTPLPQPQIEGIKGIDATPWIKKIRAPLEQYDGAVTDVAREAAEAQVTLLAKNRALNAFEAGFGEAAATGWALLTSVGEKEHAERISMSPRWVSYGRRGAGADDTTAGGDAKKPEDEEKKPT